MKRLLFLILPILLCGCTHDMNREEIDEIDLVLVLGIDYEDGEYHLSALYSTGSGADSEAGAGSGKEQITKGKGKTAYEALEELKLKNKKNITLAQAGSFLIGEEAAKQGIDRALDFLKRDETIKMESLVYILKEKKASEFMEEGIENKLTIHEDLEAMEQKQNELLTRSDNTFVNILNDMEQSYSSVLIPYLITEKSGLLIEGYAVFDELRLVDYLDRDTSDGVNFIRNTMRSFPIYLKDEVSLAVSYTATKLKADLKDDNIIITIKVDFESMLKEITTKADVFTQEELLKLTEEQNRYVISKLEKPVEYSKRMGMDILNLARLVENQNVGDWKRIEGTWSEKITSIEYRYQVRSQITKSFILGNNR
jgi:spore germination protein KC